MPSLSLKIAFPIIIAGVFVIISIIALNYESLNASFYIILSFLTVYLFLFGFATGQNVTMPVRKLLKKADDLSKGDLKSRFYSESKDELGQLANVFNRIADQLQESNEENETTRRTVSVKVQAQTQGLQETINALEQKVKNRTLEVQRMMQDLEKYKEGYRVKEMQLQELKSQITGVKEASKKGKIKK